jgi:hypothetical protein
VADTPPTRPRLAVPGPIGASRPRSRRFAWSRSPSAAPRDHRRGHGPLAKGETTLAAGLLGDDGALGPQGLLLADRQFVDANLWRQAASTGAQLPWRTRTNAVLPVLEASTMGRT